jgi:hypothetical protein
MPDETRASAGAAGVSAAPPDVAGTPAGPVQFSTDLDDSVDEEYGVRFTADYEPGTVYDPMPPPPAEDQHAMGLHGLAARYEAHAEQVAGGRAGMVGADGPHVYANTEDAEG